MSDTVKCLFHLIPVQITPCTCEVECCSGDIIGNGFIRLCFFRKVLHDLLSVFLTGYTDQWLITGESQWWLKDLLLCHSRGIIAYHCVIGSRKIRPVLCTSVTWK